MEESSSESISGALNRLEKSLIEAIRNDLSYNSSISKRGFLKKHMNLFCRPSPSLLGTEREVSLSVQAGEYFPQETYDREFQRKFLAGFINRDSGFQSALKILGKKFGDSRGSQLIAEIHLIPFCYALMNEFLKEESRGQQQFDNFASQFMRDLSEGGLRILLRIAADGLIVAEDVMLSPNDEESILIRQPKLEDYSEPVVVVERWDGDLDYAVSPPFPKVSSIIEIELKSITFAPLGGSIDPRLYDQLRTVDWLANGVIPRAHELRCILALFQSRANPYFQSLTLSLILKHLSKMGGQYDVAIPATPSFMKRSQYLLSKDNTEKLKMFWEKMTNAGMMNRINGPRRTEDDPSRHQAKPTEVAFKRYLEILRSREEPKVDVHDTIEAIEGFFTPEQETTKSFIHRVTALIQLLDIDPNRTYERLNDGWKIRSDYSHRALGWDEEDGVRYMKEGVEKMKKFQTELAKLLLNYLRISIVARILSGVSDIAFVELLDAHEGIVKLKDLLSDLHYLVSADPLTPVP